MDTKKYSILQKQADRIIAINEGKPLPRPPIFIYKKDRITFITTKRIKDQFIQECINRDITMTSALNLFVHRFLKKNIHDPYDI